MSLSPQRIRDTQFKSARRGFDQAEVETFKTDVADALESAQNDATAMEARARAAVARLQELSKASPEAVPASGDSSDLAAEADGEDTSTSGDEAITASVDEAETISRTLLLAQRTADTTVADARAEADRLLTAAHGDATGQLDAARADATHIVDDARIEARRAGESERVRVEGEVQALLARRDFLESDVEHLEQFLVAQRERITEAVAELSAIVERVPGGLGHMRRPLLSAADDTEIDEAQVYEMDRPSASDDEAPPESGEAAGESSEISEITRIASAGESGEDATGDVWAERTSDEPDDATPGGNDSLFGDDDPGSRR